MGKKIKWSIILIVLLLIAVSAPVMASASYSYETQAQTLNSLGLYDGISDTSFDPDLGTALNRETGVIMLLKLFGLDAEAEAMTDAETDAALANFSDADSIASLAKSSVAYAVKNGLVNGLPDGTFAPKANLNGKAYCTLILRQLGYTPDYNNAPAELADKGGLTPAQATLFSGKALIKDDLVGISFGALSAKEQDGGTVIDTLVAADVADEAVAVDAGLLVPEIPTTNTGNNHHSNSSYPAMTGTVAITGTAKYGQTLTADPSGLSNAGTPTYQWNRDGDPITDATGSTYSLGAADVGKAITVTATAQVGVGTGSITSQATGAIAKADGPEAPAAPTEASKTATSITLTANAAYQFSINDGNTWQDSEEFTGLAAETEYSFVARVKETATTNASAASLVTKITTTAPTQIIGVTVSVPIPTVGVGLSEAEVDNAAYYVHTLTVWYDSEENTYSAGTTYSGDKTMVAAVVTLTAKDGYTFTGLADTSITLVTAGDVSYEAGQGVQVGGTSVVFTVTLP